MLLAKWHESGATPEEALEEILPILPLSDQHTILDRSTLAARLAHVADTLQWAWETSQEFGVWAGSGEDEDANLRHRLEKAGLPEPVRKVVLEELVHLERMKERGAERTVLLLWQHAGTSPRRSPAANPRNGINSRVQNSEHPNFRR